MRIILLLGCGLAAGAVACGRTIDVPASVPRTVEVTAGNDQTSLAGQPVPTTPAVVVRDQYGAAIGGTPLTVVVTIGGGTITGAPTVSAASGPTPLGTWTLGTTPGVNVLTVTAGGIVNKPIVATGTAGPAAKLVLKSGASGLTGTVGLPIATNVVLQVLDQADNPIQGLAATITASNGGSGSLAAPISDQAGTLIVNRWFLGSLAGTQTMSVTVAGVDPVTISVQARAGQAQALVPAVTLPIRQFANAPGTTPLAVRAVDSFGNSVPGTVVTFGVRDGGGAIVGATTATTNASGIATGGTWTLGRTFAQQSVLAATVGTTTVITGQVTSAYQASARFAGTVDQAVRLRVQGVVDRIRMAVVGHIDDVPVSGFNIAGACGVVGMAPIEETIHDILFVVQVVGIDDVGGTTVQAVSCLNRGTLFGQISVINIDAADLATILTDGTFDSAVLHEMLHGLGFGGAWSISLLTESGSGDPRFLGPEARVAFVAAGGSSEPGVPVENIGATGVIDVHWRSSSFGDELMTSVSVPGQRRPFSAITIQSLGDIGYMMNRFAAESFTFIGPAATRRP